MLRVLRNDFKVKVENGILNIQAYTSGKKEEIKKKLC